ncbi:MAG: ABC transporter ATP-binding protein [Clostridiales bacterium]|nr:ABC transporter ATP-binding protein [Clostridiales bacterium]
MSIKFTNVSKEYKLGNSSFFALKNISFEAKEGEMVAILGPSGSGKSTLLNILGGLDRASKGEVIFNSQKISELSDKELTKYRRENVGFVFQFYNLIPNLTAYENVEVSAELNKESHSVNEILNAVGLSDKKNKFPQELSGGEQQRVSIARAIIKNPKLLLCDEPTGALDYVTSKEVLELLDKINQEYGTTIFIVTHNSAIASMCHRVIKLRGGEISSIKVNENRLSPKEVEW